ncbi:MAG: penicillin-binding transpeptidase domain-containing protein, partial [Planctomycetota bacterium]
MPRYRDPGVDPFTGKVLAMCSAPTFNPNFYSETDSTHRTNRAICTPFEPGSAFKPIVAAAAVDAGALNYSSEIFCENGVYRAHRGGRIRDHGESYGYLTLADGVIFSSNICMAKVGEKLGNARLYQIAKRFGFGDSTDVKLPGDSGGIIRPKDSWDGYSLRRVPFGQEISVTALQMTMAFSALANGGLLLKPYLIDKIVDSEGNIMQRGQREVVRRVLSPQVAAQTLEVMQGVVERGTGKACRLMNWTSFGKTGTAQIPGEGGYVEGAYTATFVGGGPVERPR